MAAQRETQEAVERERRGMRQEDHREAENDARSQERLRMQLEDAAASELRENLRSAPEAGVGQADAEATARRREQRGMQQEDHRELERRAAGKGKQEGDDSSLENGGEDESSDFVDSLSDTSE